MVFSKSLFCLVSGSIVPAVFLFNSYLKPACVSDMRDMILRRAVGLFLLRDARGEHEELLSRLVLCLGRLSIS